MSDPTPGTAPIVDHRKPPRGVLPRHMQTWLMAGLAVGVLTVILFTGQSTPAPRTTPAVGPAPQNPNPDRLRDYQDRLRAFDDRAREQQAMRDVGPTVTPASIVDKPSPSAPSADPLDAERKRREYESLFASNVVLSRRPDAQRLRTGSSDSAESTGRGAAAASEPSQPSLDDVAAAVMRATARNADQVGSSGTATLPPAHPTVAAPPSSPVMSAPDGPRYRVLEGMVIDTVLTNRLDGTTAAPVNCLVTNPVYSSDGQHLLIPAGARVLGTTKPVQAFGETRLAVAFHRIVLPNGHAYALDQFMGLNAIGDAGLRDQVDQHYASTFGAAAAVGLIAGFSQFLGSGLNRDVRGSTVTIAGNVGDATSMATSQTMNRFLNRLPTVTIREGHRVKVYLTSDLDLPAYPVGQGGR